MAKRRRIRSPQSHLTRIFDKTEVQSQAALVALVRGFV
jgi:DNA-binding CsgD family transcriptional regulator